jgi:hypothetical protein
MAAAQQSNVTGLRPFRTANGARVCSLAGIQAAKETLVELGKLRAGLEISIRDLDAQTKRDHTIGRVVMVLQWTKLTCDAFIGMAAALSGSGKGVKAIYGATDVVADTATKAALGQKVNYATAALDAAKKGASGLPVSKEAKFLVKSGLIKTEIVVHAINSNPKDLIKAAGDYQYELLKFTLDALDAKKSLKFTEIAKETFTYHTKVAALVDATIRESESTQLSHLSQRMTLTSLARRIERQIDRLQEFVTACEAELNPRSSIALP